MIDAAVLADETALADLLRRAAQVLCDTDVRGGSAVRLPARGRLLATGDLHDHVVHLARIVELARLGESPDHHVVLQELIHGGRLVNGMDFSHRMLGRVADLVVRHPGQVHPVLANHEIAQLQRTAVGKGGANATEQFIAGLDYSFGDGAEVVAEAIDDFIRAMPLAVLSAGGVCCSHSLPTSRLAHRFDPGVLDRELGPDDYAGRYGSAYLMCWGREHDDARLAELARAWDVRLFCIGHQSIEEGVRSRDPWLLMLNSDHERGVAVPLDLADIPGPSTAAGRAVFLAHG